MSTEPQGSRDEREFKAEVELSSGLLPGGKLALTYRRLYDKRVRRLADDVMKLANFDEDLLEERLQADDGSADLFQHAAEQVLTNGDPMLRSVLARLVAAALLDDARIHQASYLMKRMAEFEPAHIRVLWVLPTEAEAARALADSGGVENPRSVLPGTLEVISQKAKADRVLVHSVLSELQGKDFAGINRNTTDQWVLTGFGSSLRGLVKDVYGELREERSKSRVGSQEGQTVDSQDGQEVDAREWPRPHPRPASVAAVPRADPPLPPESSAPGGTRSRRPY